LEAIGVGQQPNELLSELVNRFRRVDSERADLLRKLEKMKEIADEALEPHPDPDVLRPLAEVEKEHILGVLDALNGQRAKAAAVLGIAVSTLNAKIAKYGSGESAEGPGEAELEA
jgi:DNA-binding NtrC family response regulator